jgi:hypothetical protein
MTSGEIAMPNTYRVYLNDNIRTAHLKCSACRTQIYLLEIEPERDGWETRIFGCPHCPAQRSVRLAASPDVRRREPEMRAAPVMA